jgi:hypothetical protein
MFPCVDSKIANLEQIFLHIVFTFLYQCFLIAYQLKLFHEQTEKLLTVKTLCQIMSLAEFLVFSLEAFVGYLVANVGTHHCGDSIFHQA